VKRGDVSFCQYNFFLSRFQSDKNIHRAVYDYQILEAVAFSYGRFKNAGKHTIRRYTLHIGDGKFLQDCYVNRRFV